MLVQMAVNAQPCMQVHMQALMFEARLKLCALMLMLMLIPRCLILSCTVAEMTYCQIHKAAAMHLLASSITCSKSPCFASMLSSIPTAPHAASARAVSAMANHGNPGHL